MSNWNTLHSTLPKSDTCWRPGSKTTSFIRSFLASSDSYNCFFLCTPKVQRADQPGVPTTPFCPLWRHLPCALSVHWALELPEHAKHIGCAASWANGHSGGPISSVKCLNTTVLNHNYFQLHLQTGFPPKTLGSMAHGNHSKLCSFWESLSEILQFRRKGGMLIFLFLKKEMSLWKRKKRSSLDNHRLQNKIIFIALNENSSVPPNLGFSCMHRQTDVFQHLFE